jgi:hypothetical protein
MSSRDLDVADAPGVIGRDAAAARMEQLTDEVHAFTTATPDFGRAVGRLYEIFRLTGRHAEAAYIGASIDELVLSAITALEGRAAAGAFVRRPGSIDVQPGRADADARVEGGGPAASLETTARRAVSDYFEGVVMAVPSIRAYLESVAGTPGDLGSTDSTPARHRSRAPAPDDPEWKERGPVRRS